MMSSKMLAPHIGSYLQGGHNLGQHAEDKEALNLLKQGADGQPWDVLVVQEQKQLQHSLFLKYGLSQDVLCVTLVKISFQMFSRLPLIHVLLDQELLWMMV